MGLTAAVLSAYRVSRLIQSVLLIHDILSSKLVSPLTSLVPLRAFLDIVDKSSSFIPL